MENKYYTPKIEELFVGYQCEFASDTLSFELDNYDRIQVGELSMVEFKDMITWYQVGLINYDDLTGIVRTPYLTKEQIEAEGWKQMPPPIISISKEFRDIPFIKNGYRLDYNSNSNQLAITVSGQFLFYGECKCINTFRTICKLLNIK